MEAAPEELVVDSEIARIDLWIAGEEVAIVGEIGSGGEGRVAWAAGGAAVDEAEECCCEVVSQVSTCPISVGCILGSGSAMVSSLCGLRWVGAGYDGLSLTFYGLILGGLFHILDTYRTICFEAVK